MPKGCGGDAVVRRLRSVMSYQLELVTVIPRVNSHVQDLAGPEGRRVSAGGQGTWIQGPLAAATRVEQREAP